MGTIGFKQEELTHDLEAKVIAIEFLVLHSMCDRPGIFLGKTIVPRYSRSRPDVHGECRIWFPF